MRLPGVDPKTITANDQKKERLKNSFVDEKVGSVAFKLPAAAIKDMRRLLHTILIGSASGLRCSCFLGASCLVFLNPKLSVGGVFRRVLERAIFALLERKSSAFPTATNKGTRITCRELRTVASNAHEGRLSSAPRAEH